MPVEYQVFRDTPAVAHYAPYGLGDLVFTTFYFRVPNGLVTNSNRRRPVMHANVTNKGGVTFRATLNGVLLVSRSLGRNSNVFVSEVFDWRTVVPDGAQPGDELAFRFSGDHNLRLSDAVIWYHVE
ncbi:hypothetical protein [Marivita hallyeonensis]|uniref:Uncharacterized protein n=1 Tax=Marivita hallyeonensis TaxID=996342 RepID=A0A1M5QHZ7_9RHOB|nr:hypothetical protein [Marivita hallyeonensis]SHH13113.1 hypothetical protein SAMN05443551_1347 [Marivita hallyeonensis]